MSASILVLNAGSSSVKFSLFAAGDREELLLRGEIASLATAPKFQALDAGAELVDEHAWGPHDRLTHAEAIDFLLAWGERERLTGAGIVAAGHRVVHGGTSFEAPVLVNDDMLAKIEALTSLAPLHQPHNVAAIRAVARLAPDLPQVACFDTAFHRTQPSVAQAFAIPRTCTDAGVRRYGFHGLSYEYIAGVLPDLGAETGRTIVAHLGNGASMCALRDGRSVATTMGFTALDGLVMATRCGSIDPGVLLHLMREAGLGVNQLERMLYEESGLLGASGISGDMRTLLASDDPRAAEAVNLFVYRARREIGSLAAALGGLDAIVFTGGIGENSPPIRAAICEASSWLGVDLDEGANSRGASCITHASSAVSAWIVPTNEELMIARHTERVLAGIDTQPTAARIHRSWNQEQKR